MPELKLVIPKNPKRITLTEAKVGHYFLWDFISKSEGEDLLRKPNIKAVTNVKNRCYACQYMWDNPALTVRSFGGGLACLSCPIIWGRNEAIYCISPESVYYKLAFSKGLGLDADQQRALAIKIRDVPWREDPQPSELVNDPEIMKTLTIQTYTETEIGQWDSYIVSGHIHYYPFEEDINNG